MARQIPLTVLSPTVNEHELPALLPEQACTGGGGATRDGRHASKPLSGAAGSADESLVAFGHRARIASILPAGRPG